MQYQAQSRNSVHLRDESTQN